MDDKRPVARPLAITISCAVLFLAGLFLIVFTFFFTGENPEYVFYPAVHTLLIVIIFAALSGVWNMERWGVWTFIAAIAGKIVLDLIVHSFNWWELLLLIPVVVFLLYLPQMGRQRENKK